MKQQFLTLVDNRPLAENLFRLSFIWEEPDGTPLPGQFVTLRCTNRTDPLLRRPLALSSFDEKTGEASIIYQRRGKATGLLSEKRSGDPIDILGPLGNSFPLPGGNQQAVLVAGGIGLGPLLFLHDYLRNLGLNPLFVAGFRSREQIPLSVLRERDTSLCTDDGSLGFHGTSGAYLEGLDTGPDTVFYACGPEGLLRSVQSLAEEKGAQCWVSMEQVMACGVGACMGCVIRVRTGNGYARVCTEGRIFSGRHILGTCVERSEIGR